MLLLSPVAVLNEEPEVPCLTVEVVVDLLSVPVAAERAVDAPVVEYASLLPVVDVPVDFRFLAFTLVDDLPVDAPLRGP